MFIKSDETPLKTVGPMEIREYKCAPEMSAALVDINGDHGALKCIGEDRLYFILDGEGEFTLGNETRRVQKHDAVYVPRGVPYNLKGTMKYFLVCGPEFKPEHDVFL